MAQTGEAFENAGAYSLAWLPSPSPGLFAATPAAKDFLEWLKGLRTYQNNFQYGRCDERNLWFCCNSISEIRRGFSVQQLAQPAAPAGSRGI